MFNFQIRRRSEVGPQARVGRHARAMMGLVALSLLFASTAVHAEAGGDATRVDLNRASAEELATLPGIGEAKAAAIVEFRTSSGAFTSLEELEAVRGIGPALVAKLRPHVTLGSRVGSKSPSKAGAKSRDTAAK
jgi:competence protein ComEA